MKKKKNKAEYLRLKKLKAEIKNRPPDKIDWTGAIRSNYSNYRGSLNDDAMFPLSAVLFLMAKKKRNPWKH